MKHLLIASGFTLFVVSGALAQQSNSMPAMDMKGMDMKGMDMTMMPNQGDTPSTKAYKSSMMKTMQTMPKFTGDADIDFMKHMRAHHQAAIDMANVVLANGKDAETQKLAQTIIAGQQKEIKTIDAWLKKKAS